MTHRTMSERSTSELRPAPFLNVCTQTTVRQLLKQLVHFVLDLIIVIMNFFLNALFSFICILNICTKIIETILLQQCVIFRVDVIKFSLCIFILFKRVHKTNVLGVLLMLTLYKTACRSSQDRQSFCVCTIYCSVFISS